VEYTVQVITPLVVYSVQARYVEVYSVPFSQGKLVVCTGKVRCCSVYCSGVVYCCSVYYSVKTHCCSIFCSSKVHCCM
jgi:hypothetical protein